MRGLRTVLAVAAALAFPAVARAQQIEPRLYANAPVGLNFLIVGYSDSSGGVVFDPTIPLEDADIHVHAPFAAYARALGLGRRSGQVQIAVPYAWLSGEALVVSTGQVQTRDVDGFADPTLRFSMNLHGAPALSLKEFAGWRQDLIVGASLQVTAPLGQYDDKRLVNLGTNRWTFKPEVGLSKALGRVILEGSVAAAFYTDNDDFFGGQHRSQDPIYSGQGHLIYSWAHGLWVALDVTYYTGGRTTLEGVEGDDLQKNWRGGLTLVVPISGRNSMKTYVSNGVSTRSGDDFLLLGAAWQYRWGAGL